VNPHVPTSIIFGSLIKLDAQDTGSLVGVAGIGVRDGVGVGVRDGVGVGGNVPVGVRDGVGVGTKSGK
jgi:hypothetical protein